MLRDNLQLCPLEGLKRISCRLGGGTLSKTYKKNKEAIWKKTNTQKCKPYL